jgi:predicted unusual protein kinase regulating ubiquinone biosynthesis (AarF/ABC1/UbiB family)
MTRLRGKPLVPTAGALASGTAAASAVALENAAVVALAAWSRSVAECDFFHADVHGGNLLLLGKA